MATCFENLVKHLELVIHQLEELSKPVKALDPEQKDEAYTLLWTTENLFENMSDKERKENLHR